MRRTRGALPSGWCQISEREARLLQFAHYTAFYSRNFQNIMIWGFTIYFSSDRIAFWPFSHGGPLCLKCVARNWSENCICGQSLLWFDNIIKEQLRTHGKKWEDELSETISHSILDRYTRSIEVAKSLTSVLVEWSLFLENREIRFGRHIIICTSSMIRRGCKELHLRKLRSFMYWMQKVGEDDYSIELRY